MTLNYVANLLLALICRIPRDRELPSSLSRWKDIKLMWLLGLLIFGLAWGGVKHLSIIVRCSVHGVQLPMLQREALSG